MTTASTLAPMQECALDNAIKVEEYEPEPDKELPVLWLRVELSNRLIANARAKAADTQYEALKTRCKLDGIEFSDAEFAKLLGKKGAALCVALGHGAHHTDAGQRPSCGGDREAGRDLHRRPGAIRARPEAHSRRGPRAAGRYCGARTASRQTADCERGTHCTARSCARWPPLPRRLPRLAP